MRDDDVMWIPRLFVAGVIFAGFVIMIIGIFGSFRPMQLDMERRAEVRSPQYVEARRTAILDDIAACRRLDVDIESAGNPSTIAAMRLQRRAICERMLRAEAEIPEDAVPRGTEVCK
jgi:hypothetical protein